MVRKFDIPHNTHTVEEVYIRGHSLAELLQQWHININAYTLNILHFPFIPPILQSSTESSSSSTFVVLIKKFCGHCSIKFLEKFEQNLNQDWTCSFLYWATKYFRETIQMFTFDWAYTQWEHVSYQHVRWTCTNRLHFEGHSYWLL